MKRKMSVTDCIDRLIIAKLDYMLALVKLMTAEAKYRNSLYEEKNRLGDLRN